MENGAEKYVANAAGFMQRRIYGLEGAFGLQGSGFRVGAAFSTWHPVFDKLLLDENLKGPLEIMVTSYG